MMIKSTHYTFITLICMCVCVSSQTAANWKTQICLWGINCPSSLSGRDGKKERRRKNRKGDREKERRETEGRLNRGWGGGEINSCREERRRKRMRRKQVWGPSQVQLLMRISRWTLTNSWSAAMNATNCRRTERREELLLPPSPVLLVYHEQTLPMAASAVLSY